MYHEPFRGCARQMSTKCPGRAVKVQQLPLKCLEDIFNVLKTFQNVRQTFEDICLTFPARPGHFFDIFLAHPRKGSWDICLTFWKVYVYSGLTAGRSHYRSSPKGSIECVCVCVYIYIFIYLWRDMLCHGTRASDITNL